MRVGVLFLLLGVSIALSMAQAGCIVTKRTCVDPGATRVLDGVPVTRECWGFEEEKVCLEKDAGTDGCLTLKEDAENKGEGGCTLIESICTESATDVEGNRTCFKEKEIYRCKKQIDLPSLNAAWSGIVDETIVSEDDSDCERLKKDPACQKTAETIEGDTVFRTYVCSDEELRTCSELISAGCSSVKTPDCDEALDPTCSLKTGRVRCTKEVYSDFVNEGSAAILDQTKRPTSRTEADDAPRKALENETTSCQVISNVCMDSKAGWRVLNGTRVYATCWAYEQTLRCREEKEINECERLEKTKTCTLSDSVCEEQGTDGRCAREVKTFRCSARSDEIFEGDATLTDETKTVSDWVEVSQCANFEDNAACRKSSEECLESDGGKCLKKSLSYLCEDSQGTPEIRDDCTELASEKNCRLVATECSGTDADGSCTLLTRRYECEGEETTVDLGEVCDETHCIGDDCEEVTGKANDGFLESAALLEIAREAGVYGDAGTSEIFKGIASGCSVKATGFSCCQRTNAQSAADIGNRGFQIALTAGLSAGFEAIKYAGSPYVYDLLSSHESLEGVLTFLYGEAGTGVYSPSFDFYGVSVATDSAGSLTMRFSPASFFVAVAVEFLSDYYSCRQDDQMHVMRESAGLCHYVGSFCAKKSGLGCAEKKESWVCFNSKLARLVQEGARAQLGIGWGTPEKPLLRGLTLEEFQSVDFSKMDLTGIVAEAAAKTAQKLKNPVNKEAVTARAEKRLDYLQRSDSDTYEEMSSVTGKCFAADGTLTHCTSTFAVRQKGNPIK